MPLASVMLNITDLQWDGLFPRGLASGLITLSYRLEMVHELQQLCVGLRGDNTASVPDKILCSCPKRGLSTSFPLLSQAGHFTCQHSFLTPVPF